jgi:hypothetical protein
MQHAKSLITVSVLAFALAVFTFGSGCNKNKTTDNSTQTEETDVASDQVLSEQAFEDAQSIADQGATITGAMNYRMSGSTSGPCATVSRSGDTTVIDFGTVDCTCRDGRTRRGKIIVVRSGIYIDSGSVRTITFDNFYQNGNKITGIRTVTNMGRNTMGQPFYNINVAGSILLTSGRTISATWSRVRTWTAGYTTLGTITDDIYQITGSGTITRAGGAIVGVEITAPLILAMDCRYIEAGTVKYTLPSGGVRTLNYGDTPACDNMAKLTLPSGTVYDITLR